MIVAQHTVLLTSSHFNRLVQTSEIARVGIFISKHYFIVTKLEQSFIYTWYLELNMHNASSR